MTTDQLVSTFHKLFSRSQPKISPSKLFSKQDPVTVTPGEYEYSIGGFTVAGAMLEVATNKTFEQLMTEVGKFRHTEESHKLRVLNEKGVCWV